MSTIGSIERNVLKTLDNFIEPIETKTKMMEAAALAYLLPNQIEQQFLQSAVAEAQADYQRFAGPMSYFAKEMERQQALWQPISQRMIDDVNRLQESLRPLSDRFTQDIDRIESSRLSLSASFSQDVDRMQKMLKPFSDSFKADIVRAFQERDAQLRISQDLERAMGITQRLSHVCADAFEHNYQMLHTAFGSSKHNRIRDFLSSMDYARSVRDSEAVTKSISDKDAIAVIEYLPGYELTNEVIDFSPLSEEQAEVLDSCLSESPIRFSVHPAPDHLFHEMLGGLHFMRKMVSQPIWVRKACIYLMIGVVASWVGNKALDKVCDGVKSLIVPAQPDPRAKPK